MNKLKLEKIKVFQFAVIGIINTLFSLLLYTIFIKIGFYYIVSNIISYFLSIYLAYILNSLYIFKQKYSLKKFLKFCTGYLGTMLCNLFLLFILVEYISLDKILSQIILIGIGMFFNYYFQNKITFKE